MFRSPGWAAVLTERWADFGVASLVGNWEDTFIRAFSRISFEGDALIGLDGRAGDVKKDKFAGDPHITFVNVHWPPAPAGPSAIQTMVTTPPLTGINPQ